MILRIEDLPAPDGPVRATHSPGATEKLTSRSTGSRSPPCRCMVKVLATPESSSACIRSSSIGVATNSAHSRASGNPEPSLASSKIVALGARFRGDERGLGPGWLKTCFHISRRQNRRDQELGVRLVRVVQHLVGEA